MERARRLEDLWSHIHCLGILAETGSFTAAARLQLSKASVSQRIAELEKAVGLPLVRRTTRGVSLTEAGAHLVEQTAAAFQRIEAGYSGREGPVGRAPGRAGHDRAGGAGAADHRAADSGVPQALPGRADPAGPERPAGRWPPRASIWRSGTWPRCPTHVASLIGEIRSVLVATPVPGRARYARRAGGPGAARLHPLPAALGRGGLGVPASGADERVQVPVRAASRQQQRGIARGGAGFRRHCAAARFQRGPALRDGHWSRCWAIGGWRDFADSLFAVRPYTPHVPRVVSLFVGF